MNNHGNRVTALGCVLLYAGDGLVDAIRHVQVTMAVSKFALSRICLKGDDVRTRVRGNRIQTCRSELD